MLIYMINWIIIFLAFYRCLGTISQPYQSLPLILLVYKVIESTLTTKASKYG